MNKTEAIAYLAKILKPDLLALVVQAFDDAAQLAVAEATKVAPARDEKRMTYAEAQRRRLCPYCGDQGIPYGDDERKDLDFEAYQCSNLHIFYVDRIERFTERR